MKLRVKLTNRQPPKIPRSGGPVRVSA